MTGRGSLDDQHLDELARQSLKQHPREFGAAVRMMLAHLLVDSRLARIVFAPYADTALGPILRRNMTSDCVNGGRVSQRSDSPQGEGRFGPMTSENQHQRARPATNPARIPAASIGRAVASLLLDEIMPNGKRFRDCTKAELEEIGRRDGRRSHRCLSVAAQLTTPTMTPNDAGITETELRRVDAAWNG